MTDFWRGLDELHGDPSFRRTLGREFPAGAAEPPSEAALRFEMTRRGFLRIAGMGAALSGLAGCVVERAAKIVPYASRPPEVTPGVPLFYATALEVDGYARGVLVESHEGRPTKVEGNPDHPASLGATGVFEQAAVFELCDPDRAKSFRRGPAPASWSDFVRAAARKEDGRGLHFLLEPQGSPLVGGLVAKVREALEGATFHFWSPLADAAPRAAARAAFGRPLAAHHDLRRAAAILAIDSDFLGAGPCHVRDARHFAERRRPTIERPEMSRLYAVETSLTVTGAAADHRLARRPGDVAAVLGAIAAEVVLALGRRPPGAPGDLAAVLERLRAREEDGPFAKAVARDLVQRAGESLVIAGDRQPPPVHALAALLNAALGNGGRTVWYAESALLEPEGAYEGLDALLAAMDGGDVEMLVVAGGDPAATAPADLDLAARIGRVPDTVFFGLYEGATSRACRWRIPAAHALESWGDARAYDGTISLVQPLIEPLYGGKTLPELLLAFAAPAVAAEATARDLLFDAWRERRGGADFDAFLERSLALGVVEGSALPAVEARPRWEAVLPLVATLADRPPAPAAEIELAFAPDASVHDGRFSSNAWLLELPDPITKLSWDRAALVSPRTAERLGLATGDVVEVRVTGRAVRAPVFVLPGHAEGALTLPLGYGRRAPSVAQAGGRALALESGTTQNDAAAERVVGFDAYRLRTRGALFFARGAKVERVFETEAVAPDDPPKRRPLRFALATTQAHWAIEGRPVIRRATLDEFKKRPDFPKTEVLAGTKLQLYEPWKTEGEQWAMAIDLTTCTGCGACVLACQAENNTPVVGKDDVLESREMHWLRIDRYWSGPADAPETTFQPMLCQHCEEAPCEYVCPVNATTHSPDGLNEMTYNRCIGTRFCSNNCAWKVRRFNWFDYQGEKSATEELAMNPDVSVRSRGVMEKCTFCVQRIRRAQIDARVTGRPVRDGDVATACEGACPSRAIVFGAISDPGSRVAREWRDPRAYAVLEHLGTRPRIRYLGKVSNPNPELAT